MTDKQIKEIKEMNQSLDNDLKESEIMLQKYHELYDQLCQLKGKNDINSILQRLLIEDELNKLSEKQ